MKAIIIVTVLIALVGCGDPSLEGIFGGKSTTTAKEAGEGSCEKPVVKEVSSSRAPKNAIFNIEDIGKNKVKLSLTNDGSAYKNCTMGLYDPSSKTEFGTGCTADSDTSRICEFKGIAGSFMLAATTCSDEKDNHIIYRTNPYLRECSKITSDTKIKWGNKILPTFVLTK